MAKSGRLEDSPLSPSPCSRARGPEEEVDNIVDNLERSTYLNPIVEKFLQDATQKDLFLEVFARQANMIKSRMQSFDDCHITIYDKALLKLTDNGNRFDLVPAQEFFCEEYLGISKHGNPMEAEKILNQNVVLKAIVAQAASPDGKYGDKYSAETNYGDKGLDSSKYPVTAFKEDEMDEKSARLISTYEKAKSDFEALPTSDSVAKVNAARFLRDTAENTIIYFRDAPKSGGGIHLTSNHMKELMADLQSTCRIAQASVVTLSGGRKRKFDKRAFEVLPRASRYDRSYHGQSSRRGGDSPLVHSTVEEDRSAKRWHDSKRDVRHGEEEWQDRQSEFDERDPAGYDYGQEQGHSRNYDDRRDRFHDYCEEQGHDQARRPFGYNRPVDSYQPANEAATSTHAHPYQSERYPESGAWNYEGRQEFGAAAGDQAQQEEEEQGYGGGRGWRGGRRRGGFRRGRGFRGGYF